jgi:prepilin-type processing-associated H-X9-DG protein
MPTGWKIRVLTNGLTYPEYGGTTDIPLALNGPRCRLQQPGNVYATGSGNIIPATPPGFVLEIEDGTDFDWQDLLILVEPTGSVTNAIRLTFTVKTGSFQHQLVINTGQVLNTYIHTGDSAYFNAPVPVAPGSYGVNSAAQLFGVATDTQKILALEYNILVANFVNANPADSWPAQYGARHNGSLNVLFKDGHVESLVPADIDPTVPQIYQTHWLPAVLAQ